MRFAPAVFMLALLMATACGRPESIDEFHGVRLGMTPSEVRNYFKPNGEFTLLPSGEGALDLGWRGAEGEALTEAIFEFHEGILVAIRAKHGAEYSAKVQRLDVTPYAVRSISVGEDANVETLLLARGCPAHESEVQDLLALTQ